MTGQIITWGDLDDKNRTDGTYNRRPAFVIEAERIAEQADKACDQAVDDYLAEKIDAFDLSAAGYECLAAHQYADDCRNAALNGRDKPDLTLESYRRKNKPLYSKPTGEHNV